MSARSATQWIVVAVIAITPSPAQSVPVLTVCEILAKRTAYQGQQVILVGEFSGWSEGSVLSGDCPDKLTVDGFEWPSVVWVGADPDRTKASVSSVPNYRSEMPSILAKLPQGAGSNFRLVVGRYYSGFAAAVYGRFETKDPFPRSGPAHPPIGFGHLNGFAAQIVSRPAGFWSLVPPDQYQALEALDKGSDDKQKLAIWHALRVALRGDNRSAFFAANVKDHLSPTLRATVIRVDPRDGPDRIVVAISDAKTPEAELRLDRRMQGAITPGSVVEFEGVAVTCAWEPFLLTLEVAAEAVKILPAGTPVPSASVTSPP